MRIVLLPWSRDISQLLRHQFLARCAVEDTGSAALVVGEFVSACSVQVLHVD